jgi:3-hydroxymyristoyl/3-hydroxydecanoyl-(acyl carrier protein) dehydratase
MSDHFAAFSFVDRITELEPGVRARGTFAVPETLTRFPACLVAEAVGQLAAWVAMSKIEFRGRPVAALATETIFHGDVAPGSRLELNVDIEACDDDVVAYGGFARVGGLTAIELRHCLGPMLPVQDFDAPEALRERFRLLCSTAGAPAGRFHGVDVPELIALEGVAGKSARALLQVPEAAPFFGDHFPRRPVFPATLLLDTQIRLAMDLARAVIGTANTPLSPRRMTHVKMRSFIAPGQAVELGAELGGADGISGTVRLSATIDGRTVATARLDVARSEF